jgi:putative DNA-invertase from lambdoid prophage Rac
MIDLDGDVTDNGIANWSPPSCPRSPEAERDRIRERVTRAKRDQRQRIRYLGGIVPFGFRVGEDGCLVLDEAEQAIIDRARALRAEPATFRAIQAAIVALYGRRVSLDALHRFLTDATSTWELVRLT